MLLLAKTCGVPLIAVLFLSGCCTGADQRGSATRCATGLTAGDAGTQGSLGSTGGRAGGCGCDATWCEAAPVWQGTVQLGTSGDDYGVDLGADADGNIYITGHTQGAVPGAVNHGLTDIFVMKLNRAGALQWVDQVGSPDIDVADGIAVSASGGVYVIGDTMGAVADQVAKGNSDYVVARYSDAGVRELLVQRGSAEYDKGMRVALTPSGGALVAGYTREEPAKGTEVFLTEIDAAGHPLWNARAGTPRDEVTAAAALDQAGDLYLTGATTGNLAGANAGSFDIFLMRYCAQKSQAWVKQVGTPDIDGPLDMVVNDDGNVYIVALSYSDLVSGKLEDDGLRDTFLLQYNPAGELQWIRRAPLGGKGQAETIAQSAALDKDGNIYLTGSTHRDLETGGGRGDKTLFLLKYDFSGKVSWVRYFGADPADEVSRIILDSSNHLFVIGTTIGGLDGNNSAGGSDAFVMKFDTQGAKL